MGKSLLGKISDAETSAKETSVFKTFIDNKPPVDTYVPPVDDGPLAGLVEAIEAGYAKSNAPRITKKKSFSPSNLVWNHGVCSRFWYLAFQGAEFYEEKTGKQITNMDNGTDRHARIQKALEDAGILIENEREARHDYPPIFGKVDSFITWKGTEFIVEIKTCTQEAFDYHRRTMTASAYQVVQLLIYMKIFKKKHGIMLYENKNTHELLAVPITVTQRHVDFVEYMFDWMRQIWDAHEAQTIPMVPFRNNDIKICQSCPIQKACKAADSGTLKIPRRKSEKDQF